MDRTSDELTNDYNEFIFSLIKGSAQTKIVWVSSVDALNCQRVTDWRDSIVKSDGGDVPPVTLKTIKAGTL